MSYFLIFLLKQHCDRMSANKKGKGKALVAQMGMFHNMADMEDAIYGDEDDDDLEAELLALAAEDASPTRGSPKKVSPTKGGDKAGGLNVPQTGMKKIPSGLLELDRMVAESMKDIDDDVSDTDDPDLEAELLGLEKDDDDEVSYEPPVKTSPVAPKPTVSQAPASGGSVLAVLSERLAMYEKAHNNAVAAGDTSKAKRLDRGIKALKDQTKKAKSGKPVPEEDIPPPVALGASSKPTPPRAAPEPTPTYEPTTSTTTKQVLPSPKVSPPKPVHAAPAPYKPPENLSKQDAEVHHMLTSRREQFKSAALEAKHRGDPSNASRYLRTYKQFESVIKAVENGQPIDLSQMPPPPPGFKAPEMKVTRESMQASASTPEEEAVPTTSAEEKQKIYSAPQSAGSLMEALEQRLTKYKEGEQKAKEEENGSKARRMGRIVKQYQDAIKITKAGKPYAYEDLPSPPGFPPLPAQQQQAAAPAAPPKPAAVSQQPAANTSHHSSQKSPQTKSPTKPLQRQMSAMSRAEQQAIFLQERQLQFKKAAFKAKASGDIELAKKYLRQAKGFDQMIEASHSGLPVNLSNIPKPPGAEETAMGNLEFVKEGGENGKDVGDRDEMYKKLEQDLIQQIRTATTNAEHFTKLGDVSTASKFDKMCQSSRKDLDALKNAYKHGDPVPRFHYENRTFSMVQSCTDLGDNDLEICVIRGINYNLPSGYKESDLDTYVKYEFPFPKDDQQKGDSSTCKNTNCPEYDQSFKVNIERKSRVFSRVLNSKSMKIDVFYKRGLFKSDKLLGSANIKLQPLENTCVLHDSYDLMDGRKAVGGKLEIKLRIRNPFVGKQVEEVKEKWLVIDKFERSLPAASTASKSAPAKSSQNENLPQMPDVTSMEVLKYEKQLLEQQIRKYQGKLKPSEMESFQHKVTLIDKRIEQIREQIRKSGVNGLRAYANTIEKSQNQYLQEAKAVVQQGNREKAQIIMTKKKLVEREVESIRMKLQKS